MTQGVWAYSTGDDLDQCPRGVYRESKDGDSWTRMAPLPYVLERLIRRVDGRRKDAVYYRLAMTPDAAPSDVVICDEEQVRTGEWANKLDVALSQATQIVQAAATAILDTAREHAESRELAPRVHADGLQLPPSDVGPAGYGDLAPGEDPARDAWREIATIAARSPRLALTLGVSLGGLYVSPLHRQSFVWFLVGEGGKGKTTALTAAAALYGDPSLGLVVKPWNTTPIGLVQELGGLSVLPAFRDELGAAGFRPGDLEKLIFSITQGANRTTGGKTGIAKTSGRWDGVLLSTGNDSILGRITNEGAARRIIEVETPITSSAADAERLDEVLIPEGFGWPLRWLNAAGLDVEGFGQLVATAEDELPLPDGGVPRGLGRHLALAVAGAARLETITGITGMRDAAMTEARELLERQMAEIREHGLTPADRVLRAVREAWASRPGCYPTRKKYIEQRSSDFGLARDIEGWDLTDDRHPGDLAVMTGKLEAICQAAGITNSRTGLRDLARLGLLVRSQEKDGRLRRHLRVGGEKHEVYVFLLNDEDETSDNPPDGPQDRNAATPQNRNDGPTDEGQEQLAADEHVCDGPAGPVFRAPHVMGVCRACGTAEQRTWDAEGVICAPCATAPPAQKPAEQPAEPAPAKDTTPARSRRPRTNQRPERERLELCGVLDNAGLWLPGQEQPTAVELPADAGAAYRLAAAHRLRQLWIHPSAHTALGIPESRTMSADVTPATAVEHPWTSADGYRVDTGHGAGLAAWVNVQPTTEDGRRIGLAFPAYDHNRTKWHTAPTGKVLLEAVLRFAATTGEPFYMSLNETSAAILRKTADELSPVWPSRAEVPEPIGKVRHLGDWSRVLTDDEDGQAVVDRYDINAAEASVNTGVFVGVGEPELIELGTFRRAAMKETAGYVLANVPRHHPGLDPRLPDLLTPWRRVDERDDTAGGPAWAPVELLCLLDELGVPIEPDRALLWRTSRRLLRPYGERISKARLALVTADADDTPAALALAAVKALYKSRIGDFNRESSRLYRPDVRDMIICKARCNAYRSLRKIAKTSGRYPIAFHVDAAYYVSDDTTSEDREAEGVRPAGMTIAPRMGAWKHEVTFPLARVREFLGERSFAAKVEKMLKGER